jgi:hypothetical protein
MKKEESETTKESAAGVANDDENKTRTTVGQKKESNQHVPKATTIEACLTRETVY